MKSYERIAGAARNWPTPGFDPALALFIRTRYGRLTHRFRRIASAGLAPVEVKTSIPRFIPALGGQHALAQTESFGFQFLEPQASSGIANFCQDTARASDRDARCRATVRALLARTADNDTLRASLDAGRGFQAVAEDPLPSNEGRMDLVISWINEADQPCCVIVEMKFGHVVGRGQLEDYGQQGLRNVDQRSQNLRLVLLTFKGGFRKVDRRRLKLDWQPASWLNFLRTWELELANIGETSPAFALFRRQLWLTHGV